MGALRSHWPYLVVLAFGAALATLTAFETTTNVVVASAQPGVRRAAEDPHLGIPVGGGPIDVGTIPPGLTAIDAASCGRCHPAQYAEWERSVHHTAFTNPVFVAEYGRRERIFCARCHAPRAEVASDGIDCASCHVRDGAVLNPTVSGRAPHASYIAPSLAEPLACARCHEFDFENQPGERLQRSFGEWQGSAAFARGESCQHCHMAERDGHHRHDAPGSRDATMRERAIDVHAELATAPDGSRSLHVTLRVTGAGHAVPTGDMFRRLEVSAWPRSRPDEIHTAWLLRRFRIDREGWHESSDTRVPERGERSVTIALDPVASPEPIEWAVYLWLLPRAEARAANIPVEDVRHLVASGTSPVE